MNSYDIFIDVSVDVDPIWAQAKNIHFIGMNYTLGEEDRYCEGIESEETLKLFYDGQRSGDVTRTSQITPQKYMDAFRPVLQAEKDLIYISLSSGLTKTFDSVQLAKTELEEEFGEGHIFPVDSLAATGGMGLLLELAVAQRDEGLSAEENAKKLQEATSRICHVFMVDDLMYLMRGGRVSAMTAVAGTMLNIKPILVIAPDGSLVTVEKKRGEKQALGSLLARYLDARESGSKRIYVTHCDASDRADSMIAMLRAEDKELNIRKQMMTPIIGAHTGPGFVSVIFWGDREKIGK